ncbi:MAG: histidine kinase [Clostridia bacterium]|nr:histidine kinase [Clostridia bacterium]
MSNNVIFNITVCVVGILIFTIHAVNIIVKKEKRKDERNLFDFLVFTIIHFFTYLVFSVVKLYYTSNAYVKTFYTIFYIMNNIEVLLLFRYMLDYVDFKTKTINILSAINISLFAIFTVLDIVNVFTGIFFDAVGGEYQRSKTMIISQGYQLIIFMLVLLVTAFNKDLIKREKIAFAMYCILPFVAIIIQNIFKGYAIAYASIIFAVEILFLFLNVQRNIALSREEEKNKEAQIKLMLSQIQPHFIYNSLSAISTLITIDPDKAQSALDDFTEYLRHNLSSLTETRLIHFKEELKHIKTYVSLEKMRFKDRINVIYDIQAEDFSVPPLCIQPIVENAIKHGILKKIEGGNLTIKTYETNNEYVVEITDDGVGFNMNDVNFEENKHFGLNNIKYRIESMCKGSISVDSKVNEGTKVVVRFEK